MNQVRVSISPATYLKFQILMKRPIGNFDKGFSELLINYEKLENYYKKNVMAFETMPLLKDPCQYKWEVSL